MLRYVQHQEIKVQPYHTSSSHKLCQIQRIKILKFHKKHNNHPKFLFKNLTSLSLDKTLKSGEGWRIFVPSSNAAMLLPQVECLFVGQIPVLWAPIYSIPCSSRFGYPLYALMSCPSIFGRAWHLNVASTTPKLRSYGECWGKHIYSLTNCVLFILLFLLWLSTMPKSWMQFHVLNLSCPLLLLD